MSYNEESNWTSEDTSSDIDSSAEELQLLKKLRLEVQDSYEGELTMRDQLSKYRAEITELKKQLSDKTSTYSSEEREMSTASLVRNTGGSETSSVGAKGFRVQRRVKQTHKEYIAELEQFADSKFWEAEKIIRTLKAGESSLTSTTMVDPESGFVPKRMARERDRLVAEKEMAEAKLRSILHQVNKFKKQHQARQEKRRMETFKLIENMKQLEAERNEIYQLIAKLFPQFASPVDKLTATHIKQILLSVSQRVM